MWHCRRPYVRRWCCDVDGRRHRHVLAVESDAWLRDTLRQTTDLLDLGDRWSIWQGSADRAARSIHGRTRQPYRRCQTANCLVDRVKMTSACTGTGRCQGHERRSLTTAGTSGRVASTDHCSRWGSDIDDLDTIWATDIIPRDHSIQCASELVSSSGLV